MPLKVTSGKSGKVYDMPWTLATDPSDDDIDRFIASQELQGQIQGPSKVNPLGGLKDFKARGNQLPPAPSGKEIKENFFKNAIPKFDTNDISLASESYPVRAGKELFNTFISDASSPSSVAIGGAVGGIGKALKPYLGKMLPFLNQVGKSAELPVTGPKPVGSIAQTAPKIALADAGEVLGAKTGNTSSRIPNNTQSAGTIPIGNEFTPVGSEPVPVKPVFNAPDPVATTIANQAKGEARTLTQQGVKRFVLPQDLRSSKPRFNMGNKIYIPQFENDLDKAAYIIAQKTPSKRDSDFLKFFMDSTGMTDEASRLYGQQVRARIKANLVGQAEGDVKIPDMFSGYKGGGIKPPLTKTDITNAAVVKEAISKPKVRIEGPGKVNLINPSKQTVDEMMSKGYHPTGEINEDGSIKLIQKVGQVGPSTVSAPVNPDPLNFKPGGAKTPRSFIEGTSGGGNVPPNTPTAVNAPIPSPKPPKYGPLTRIGTEMKSATAGLDLSAPLRQGRALMHKKEFYKAIPDMFRSMKSEEGYKKLMSSIESHPSFDIAKESKLALMDLGDDLSKREEAIMGSMVEKIPGIGKLYRGSNRAYSGFLNKLRMDTFSSLLDDASKITNRNVDPKEIADLVNVLTGRGKLGSFEGAAPLLNATFFSPRFLSSRVKLLTSPVSYANADPFVRKEALKGLAALVGSQATLIGLYNAAKGDVKKFDPTNSKFYGQLFGNPTSSDFMKFKAGNSRVDTNAGVQQLFVLASRLASGKTTSSTTGKTSKMDTGKFGSPTSGQTIWRFATSKEAPLLGLVSDLWTGQNFKGEKQGVTESVMRRVTPMIAQDLVDLAQEDSKYSYLLMAPGLFGASVQTYGKKKK